MLCVSVRVGLEKVGPDRAGGSRWTGLKAIFAGPTLEERIAGHARDDGKIARKNEKIDWTFVVMNKP